MRQLNGMLDFLAPPSGRLGPWRALVYFGLVFALAMSVLATRGGLGRSWQAFYGPAVFMGCTGTFGLPEDTLHARDYVMQPVAPTEGGLSPEPDWHGELRRFVRLESESFDCDLLPETLEVRPFGAAATPLQQGMHREMLLHLLVAGAVWSVTGVSWDALTPVAALYYAGSVAFLFSIARLFAGLRLSLLLAAAFMALPEMWLLLSRLRDFGKVLPTYAAVWMLFRIARARQERALVGWLAALGVTVGLGLNVRTDFLLFGAGLCLLAILGIALRPELPRRRLIAGGTLLLGAIVGLSYLPGQLLYPDVQDYLFHIVPLGLADARLLDAQVVPPSISIMPIFLDQSVLSYAQLLADEQGMGPVPYRTTLYGDHARAASLQALALVPFTALMRIPGIVYDSFGLPLSDAGDGAGAALGRLTLVALGVLGLLRLWRRTPDEAFMATGLILGSAAVSSILYQPRHALHYQVLIFGCTIAGALWLATRLFGRNGAQPTAPSGPPRLFTTIYISAFVAVLAGSAFWQHRAVSRQLGQLAQADRVPVAHVLAEERMWTRIRARVAEDERPLLAYVFDLQNCGRERLAVRVHRDSDVAERYVGTSLMFLEQSKPQGPHPQIVATAYRDAFNTFGGVSVPTAALDCFARIERLSVPELTPYLWHAKLDGDPRILGGFRF